MVRRFILCGFARSGSHLLYQMIRSSSELFVPTEQEVRAISQADYSDEEVPILTKRPRDILVWQQIVDRFPDDELHFIVTIRDPRDMLVSIHPSVKNDFFLHADFCYFRDGERKLGDDGILNTAAAISQLVSSYQNVHLVYYEDLLKNPEEVKDDLYSRLGIKATGMFSDFAESSLSHAIGLGGLRPLDRSNPGKWKQCPERICSQFLQFPELHQVMVDFAYEPNTDWFEEFHDNWNVPNWRTPVEHWDGIVTAVDGNYEWILPWFMTGIRRHNPGMPITVIDLGMSKEMIDGCHDRGVQVIRPLIPHLGATWYSKPLAVLHSPYQRSLWLDVDCEVKGPLQELFDMLPAITYEKRPSSSKLPVVTSIDTGASSTMKDGLMPDESMYQVGVLLVNHGHPAIRGWAYAMNYMAGYARGDQEAFARAMYLNGYEVLELPKKYTGLRVEGPPAKDCIIYHWTGPAGKDSIRTQIKSAIKKVKDKGEPDLEDASSVTYLN